MSAKSFEKNPITANILKHSTESSLSMSSKESDIINFDKFVQILEIGIQDQDDEAKIKLLFDLYLEADGAQTSGTNPDHHRSTVAYAKPGGPPQVSEEGMFVILKNIVGTNMTDESLRKIILNTFQQCDAQYDLDKKMHVIGYEKFSGLVE